MLVIASIIAIVVVSVLLLRESDFKKLEPFDAIPVNTAIVIDVKSSKRFLADINENNNIYKDILNVTQINSKNSLFHFIDSLSNSGVIKSDIVNERFVLSFIVEGKSNVQQLGVVNIKEEQKDNIFKQLLEEFKTRGSVKTREFNNVEIAEFKLPGDNNKLFSCVKNNLLVFSFSSKLMEETISLLLSEDKNSINNLKEFKNIHNTAGKNEIANIYVNMKSFPDLFNNKISEEFKPLVSNMKYFSEWTEFDLSFFKDRINLNGFSEMTDSSTTFIKILNSQIPAEATSLKILPNTTSFYLTMAFSDGHEYDNNLIVYLKELKTADRRDQKLKKIEETTGVNLKSFFYPMIESEICYAITNIDSKDPWGNCFTIFNVKSKSNTEQEIENMIQGISLKLGKPVDSFKESIFIDEKTSINCFFMPFTDFPELLFGPAFKNCTGEYLCFINNFVVIANSKISLQKFIHDALLNNTLNTSIEHYSFLEHFSGKSNMFLYFSFYKGYDLLLNLLDGSVYDELHRNMGSIYKLGNFGYQINKTNNRLYNNIVIKHSDNNLIEKTQTVWESRLDTLVAIKPSIVINHDNNSKEILVQDKQNVLYLLSDSGREIWKVKLDESIISKIYQIDFYKNNKLQYLFSTGSKIHLIDRLGNYVEKYPLQLRSKATGPMSLFDYENDNNYRIIIPCEDKKVYLYDKEANLIKGWDFAGSENNVNNEISHYKIGKEDYIVLNDDYKAYFLSRKGDLKINFTTKFKFSKNNKIWLDSSLKDPRFITTDEDGTIRLFYTNGKQDSLKIKKFSPEHFFTIKDIDCDGKNDFVFVDGNKIEVYNSSKKMVMSYEFESDITYEPSFYSFPQNQVKTGIVCEESKKIYLLNSDGSIYDGFPLHGLSQFSIGKFSNDIYKFNLIVGGLYNLLYNYEIKINEN